MKLPQQEQSEELEREQSEELEREQSDELERHDFDRNQEQQHRNCNEDSVD